MNRVTLKTIDDIGSQRQKGILADQLLCWHQVEQGMVSLIMNLLYTLHFIDSCVIHNVSAVFIGTDPYITWNSS